MSVSAPSAPFATGEGSVTVLLECVGIHMYFGGVRALQNANLTVTQGVIHGIVGPNGSGKSTLLNVINRLITPQKGTVHFAGVDLMNKRAYQIPGLGIARTFQTPVMFRGMTVLENVLVGMQPIIRGGLFADLARLPSYSARERDAKADARSLLADLLHFSPAEMQRKVESLNFAEQRRVELARAMAMKPKMVVLDEPAAGQTEEEVHNFGEMLRQTRDSGTTVLIVEHNVDFVRAIADRITVLDHGSVLAEGEAEVFTDKRVVEAYMGSKAEADDEELQPEDERAL